MMLEIQDTPRWRSRRFAPAFVALGVAWCIAAPARAEAFELEGAWYVLVHYAAIGANGGGERADERAAPPPNRWEDKVWVFAPRGSRLTWTEYPVVVLRDESGRSETLASGRRIRTAGTWRPNARQRAEIAAGPGVVDGWARSKTLRGDAASGYRSRGAVNRESTSVIGYSEQWEIEGLSSVPTFRRRDELSGERAEALAGLVEYRGTHAEPGELSGEFVRDDSLRGRFTMQRIAAPKAIRGNEEEERSNLR